MEKDLSYLFRRIHPVFRRNRDIWEHSAAAYAGGEEYLRRALVRHVSEVELEFAERMRRAYYFNYPRKLARLITQCILAAEPQRDGADPELVEDFSRTGLRADEVMRQVSTLLNVFGSVAMTIDMPFFEGEVDCERRRREKLRPAVRVVSPLAVPDWAYGSDGELDWIIIDEKTLVDRGPYLAPAQTMRRRLLTRTESLLFEAEPDSASVRLISGCRHDLGLVPAVLVTEADGFAIGGGHYFEDVVRISDAMLNNESEAQMNVVKQMFGLLVISESFARAARPVAAPESCGGENAKFSHVLARSAALWETPEERGISRYISPSGADTAAIRAENDALKRELFDVVGMSLMTRSRDAQTAEAKAWDYHQVKQFLSCRADLLEQTELRVWRIMSLFDPSIAMPSVCYNREFAVTDLKSSIESLIELKNFSGGGEYQREIARAALYLLEKVKKIDPERRRAMLSEIAGNEVSHA
ncbi:MAG: hypothetical protein PHI35_01435 [Victivallaceae bacterium]|nr:hypothetical protein [Victivallaceae bacterium]